MRGRSLSRARKEGTNFLLRVIFRGMEISRVSLPRFASKVAVSSLSLSLSRRQTSITSSRCRSIFKPTTRVVVKEARSSLSPFLSISGMLSVRKNVSVVVAYPTNKCSRRGRSVSSVIALFLSLSGSSASTTSVHQNS